MLKEYNFLAYKQNQNRSFLRNKVNLILIEAQCILKFMRNLRIKIK